MHSISLFLDRFVRFIDALAPKYSTEIDDSTKNNDILTLAIEMDREWPKMHEMILPTDFSLHEYSYGSYPVQSMDGRSIDLLHIWYFLQVYIIYV